MFIDWARLKLLSHHLALRYRLVRFDIVALHFRQIELLGSQDRAWSHDPDPADEGFCRNLVVFHCP